MVKINRKTRRKCPNSKTFHLSFSFLVLFSFSGKLPLLSDTFVLVFSLFLTPHPGVSCLCVSLDNYVEQENSHKKIAMLEKKMKLFLRNIFFFSSIIKLKLIDSGSRRKLLLLLPFYLLTVWGQKNEWYTKPKSTFNVIYLLSRPKNLSIFVRFSNLISFETLNIFHLKLSQLFSISFSFFFNPRKLIYLIKFTWAAYVDA